MNRYEITYVGELYLTIEAKSQDEASNQAHQIIEGIQGYFKVRDSDWAVTEDI